MVNVTLPPVTLNNGSLSAHIFLKFGRRRSREKMSEVSLTFPLTSYVVPQPEAFNLMSSNTSKVGRSCTRMNC